MASLRLDGMPVGLLLCQPRHVQAIIKALDALGWRKKSVKISKVENGALAVALVPAAAAALSEWLGACDSDPEHPVPLELRRLVEEGSVVWKAGLRAGAHAALGQACGANFAAGAASGARGFAFTFAELFAGIGGFRLALESLGECHVYSDIYLYLSIHLYLSISIYIYTTTWPHSSSCRSLSTYRESMACICIYVYNHLLSRLVFEEREDTPKAALYIYIYIYIHVYIYIYIYIYICLCVFVCMHVYVYLSIYLYILYMYRLYIYIHIHLFGFSATAKECHY